MYLVFSVASFLPLSLFIKQTFCGRWISRGSRIIVSLRSEASELCLKGANGFAHHAVFNNPIVRSKWNYQFTPEFSLRFIAQYNGVLTNPAYSSLQPTKNMNFDV